MSSKEAMLERVRRALGRAAGDHEPVGAVGRAPGNALRAVPPGERVDYFEKALRDLAGSAYRAGSIEELEKILHQLLPPSPAATVTLSRNPLLAKLDIPARVPAHRCVTWADRPTAAEQAAFRQACFAAQAGITGVDFVLAESGTLVLTSETEGSQLVSLAPPVHIALYTRSQVVGSLEEVLAGLGSSEISENRLAGRSVVFITGPSRTADIEQISIRGVHGPVAVHAILIESGCLGSQSQ